MSAVQAEMLSELENLELGYRSDWPSYKLYGITVQSERIGIVARPRAARDVANIQ
jgi:hypothetical protein